MEEISFLERISKIFGLVTSSSFFISLLLIVVLTIGFTIFNSKVKTKIPKIAGGIGYLLITIFIIFKYAIAFYNLQDSFTDKLFSSFYFPNLITYVSILLISVFVIIMDFISKNKTLIFKIIGVTSFGIILILLALILDTVIKKEIDVYSAKSIYESNDLMILIQATTAVFFIWMVIELIDYYSRKIAKRLDNNTKSSQINNNNLKSSPNNRTTNTSANKTQNYNVYNMNNIGNNNLNNKTYNRQPIVSNNQNYGTNYNYNNSINKVQNSNNYNQNNHYNSNNSFAQNQTNSTSAQSDFKKTNNMNGNTYEKPFSGNEYKKVNYLGND